MTEIKKPTGEECNLNAKVYENAHQVGYAIWYPQMGGYVGCAVAILDKEWNESDNGRDGGCFDVYVWHDGEFPFGGEYSPIYIIVIQSNL